MRMITQKIMVAKYAGRCSLTGYQIRVGDRILYDARTRKATLAEAGSAYQSNRITIGGTDYYRNKAGRCEDAPCCGCCTI